MEARDYDVVVVGAGHAGCEAAASSARMGAHTLLVTFDLARLATQPCNPSVGGVGKGHIVREVGALGGIMPIATDCSGIHFRRLNTSKGPAVQATRVQTDSAAYTLEVTRLVRAIPGLDARPAEVVAISTRPAPAGGARRRIVDGVVLEPGGLVPARCVIVATGTFLDAKIHIGERSERAGRAGERPSDALARALTGLGLPHGRLKTGTCPRVDSTSIDTDRTASEPGDDPAPMFSERFVTPPLPQMECRVTATTPQTHAIIRSGLDRSPLYSGAIHGLGPRYCPSVEDKVVRFPHHERHVIFLEPEGLHSRRVYLSGLSTSLPADVQEPMVRSLPGLEHAVVLRWGYAVEYMFFDPRALRPGLESDLVQGLFLAGQINGTSGYEEAAGQGIMAGINAALACRGEEPVVLARDEAYIGVMIDDLVTAGVDEPYRMLTARAEYRLLLREDNAQERLVPLAHRLGLVPADAWRRFTERASQSSEIESALRSSRIGAGNAQALGAIAVRHGLAMKPGVTLAELLLQPGPCIEDILPAVGIDPAAVPHLVLRGVETRIRYEGYLARDRERARRLLSLDRERIPDGFVYRGLPGLSLEAADRLDKARPSTLGQALRIPGMTPAAVALLQVLVKRDRGR